MVVGLLGDVWWWGEGGWISGVGVKVWVVWGGLFDCGGWCISGIMCLIVGD